MTAGDHRVYIVDDDEGVRESLRALLESYDFTVADSDSAAALFTSLRQDPPDCVILDLHLPEFSGLQTLHRLKELHGKGKGDLPPIVIITGRGDRTTERSVLAAGADAYLEKPFESAELLETMRRVMAR